MLLKYFPLLLFVLSHDVISTSSAEDDAYVIGVFPDPVYDEEKSVTNNISGTQTLKMTIKNPGEMPEEIGFHAFLPENADMTSFSMNTAGIFYKAKKSDRKMAQEVMKKAHAEDHNAVIYVPKPLLDKYDGESQAAENTVHIKSHHQMTFDLQYSEDLVSMATSGKKILNRARILLDMYGVAVEDMSVELSSPNYPESYPNSADITWWVRVPVGKTVSLQITDLDIEECCDRLAIYDGVSIRDDIIAEVTGNFTGLSTRNFQSTRNSMFLRLSSDCSLAMRGFKAVASATGGIVINTTKPPNTTSFSTPNTTPTAPLNTTCSGVEYLYAYTYDYYLTSPGYPYSYSNYLDCYWRIQSAYSAYVVQLTVLDMNLESCCDKVYVYDGYSTSYPLIDVLTGTQVSTVLYSTGTSMYLNFRTDGSVTRSGFQFTYTAAYHPYVTTDSYPEGSGETTAVPIQQACSYGEHLELYTGYGYIYSQSYPNNYNSNSQCTWYIHGHTYPYVVRLSVYDLSLGYGDRVMVYDGSSQYDSLIYSFTQGYYPNSVYSTGLSMYVQFYSDNYNEGRFQFRYDAYYQPQSYTSAMPTYTTAMSTTNQPNTTNVCSGTTSVQAHTHYHSLYSPNYPSSYYNNLNCQWRIYNSYGSSYVINLVVQIMDLEQNYDYLRVYDGYSSSYPLLASLTGNTVNTALYSTGDYMFLNFVTDGSVTRTGFVVNYEATYRQATTVNYPEQTTNSVIGQNNCSITHYVYDYTGYITSNNYPYNYPNYLNECWYFPYNYQSYGHYHFEAKSFNTEQYNDVVTFNSDYSGELRSYSGNYVQGYSFGYYYYSDLFVQFQTNSWQTYQGFNITFWYDT